MQYARTSAAILLMGHEIPVYVNDILKKLDGAFFWTGLVLGYRKHNLTGKYMPHALYTTTESTFTLIDGIHKYSIFTVAVTMETRMWIDVYVEMQHRCTACSAVTSVVLRHGNEPSMLANRIELSRV